MVMYAKIRRMHFREHLTISEIQRRTSLSRNTIKKWLRGGEEPQQQRRHRDSKLTPFEPELKLALETDSHRPKRDRRTAKRLFEAIRQADYTGGHSQVTDGAAVQKYAECIVIPPFSGVTVFLRCPMSKKLRAWLALPRRMKPSFLNRSKARNMVWRASHISVAARHRSVDRPPSRSLC